MWPFKFPYTNLHELNLDWILDQLKQVKDTVTGLPSTIRDIVSEMLKGIDFKGVGKPLEMFGANGDANADTEALEDAYSEADSGIFLSIKDEFRNFLKTIIKTVISQPAFNSMENGGRFNFLHGTRENPTSNTNPDFFVQKIIYDASQRGNPNSHKLGSGDFETEFHGSGATTPNDGGFVGLTGACVGVAQNQGTVDNPNWDLRGPVIGLHGYAESRGYTGGVTTGIWANAATPNLSRSEIEAIKGNNTVVGMEVNCWIRHPDMGYKPFLSGMGNVVGILMNNYQEYGGQTPDKRDFSFGMILDGTPLNGDYTGNDNDTWNGYHTGIHIDKITNYGIDFGGYVSDGAVMIKFPENYGTYAHRPKAAISIGDNKINLGRYYGATSDRGDILRTGDNILYHNDKDVLGTVLIATAVLDTDEFVPDRTITVNIGGTDLKIPAMTVK